MKPKTESTREPGDEAAEAGTPPRRGLSRADAVTSVAAAALLAVVFNVLSAGLYARWDMGASDYYRLSDTTRRLIASLEADVEALAFVRDNQALRDEVRSLLREYRVEAEKHKPVRLRVEMVDPDRDVSRVRDLSREIGLGDTEGVLFRCGSRLKFVESRALSDYSVTLESGRAIRKRTTFKGEQEFSAAIRSVVETRQPVVYLLQGHGERDVADYGANGYAQLRQFMLRDNFDIKLLRFDLGTTVPRDASAIVIAGPSVRVPSAAVDRISEYLEQGGRVLLLADPGGATGFESLLEHWRIRLGPEIVVGPTLTGRELIVSDYGDHPIARRVSRMTTLLYLPRPVEPLDEGPSDDPAADRPRATALAFSSAQGWAESNLDQSPPIMDPKTDRPGPISVAAAVERGAAGDIDAEIRRTRLVVVGDSYFVSNAALKAGAGANVDFFLSALNWLVERDSGMGIGPKSPAELRLGLTAARRRAAYWLVAGGPSLVAACFGLAVWMRRRH